MGDPIERAGDRGRRADLALDDDHVLRGDGGAAELCQQRLEQRARVDPLRTARQRVAGSAERVRGLDVIWSSRTSRETVAWVTRQPAAASASISSSCVPSRLRSTRLAIRRCRSTFRNA